jgi:hypothetical protein
MVESRVPIPLAWLVAFALGAVFARVAETEIARLEGPLVASRPMAIVLGFAGLVFLPVAGYFAAFHGDWAYLYLVSWQNVPSAVDLALVFGAACLVPAGFVTGVWLIRSRRSRSGQAIVALAGVPAGLAAAVAVVFVRRLSVSASAAQYHGGFGVEPIATSPLGKGVLWGLLALVAGGLWAVRSLRSVG